MEYYFYLLTWFFIMRYNLYIGEIKLRQFAHFWLYIRSFVSLYTIPNILLYFLQIIKRNYIHFPFLCTYKSFYIFFTRFYFEKLNALISPDGNENPVPFFGADCNEQQDEALL